MRAVPEPPPYRDERATMQAEIDRLRGEVAGARAKRWGTARRVAAGAALVAVDLFCFMKVEGWVNARSDGGFTWAALTVVALVVAHIVFAQRVFGRGD